MATAKELTKALINELSLKHLIEHPHTQQSYDYFAQGKYKNPDHPNTIYAFWANDYELKDDVGVHHGREIALAYQRNHVDPPVTLMENFEGSGSKVHVLNIYETRADISMAQRSLVCGVASYSYGRSAAGSILTSVKGANINSFFRTTELNTIMNNHDITDVINVSRGDPDGTTYDKRTAYHVMRDEWMNSAKNRFIRASASLQVACQEAYNTALESLSHEIIHAQRVYEERYPFSGGDPNKQNDHTRYTESDRTQERQRIISCADLLIRHQDLADKIDIFINIPPKPSVTSQIIDVLAKREESAKNATLLQEPKVVVEVVSATDALVTKALISLSRQIITLEQEVRPRPNVKLLIKKIEDAQTALYVTPASKPELIISPASINRLRTEDDIYLPPKQSIVLQLKPLITFHNVKQMIEKLEDHKNLYMTENHLHNSSTTTHGGHII